MNHLQKYFSGILRSKEEILAEIRSKAMLHAQFCSWTPEQQENFLAICTGAKGMRILSDAFFKEVMNPEYDKSRMEGFLSIILRKKVKVLQVLPNDSTRIADEVTLLVTDIVVELEDGSIANVEVQKIPYSFPGGRCACYSSDLMLRQYKRVRERSKNTTFSYKSIKTVYLIVLYETSPTELRNVPQLYVHHAKQVFDTGLDLDMLQEYVLIALDNFKETMQNKKVETETEAWLTFLSCDEPDRIMELIQQYPEFEAMYQTLYQVCLNTERVMAMFSEELYELDRNTIKLMIEEQQEKLDALNAELLEKCKEIERTEEKLENSKVELKNSKTELENSKAELENSKAELESSKSELASQKAEIASQQEALLEKDRMIEKLKERLADLGETI